MKKVSIKKNDLIIGLLLVATVLWLFCRNILDINISKNFLLVVVGLLFIITDFKGIFAYIAFIIPLSTGIPYNYILCMAIMVLIFKYDIKFNKLFLALILILSIELYACINNAIDVKELASIFMVFFLIYYFVTNSSFNDNNNYSVYLRSFIYGTLISGIFIILMTSSQGEILDLFLKGYRFGQTNFLNEVKSTYLLLEYNPNSYGNFCVFALYFLITLRVNNFNKKIDYIVFLLILLFGCLTLSITFYVSFVIASILLLIEFKSKIKKVSWKNVLGIITLVFLVFLVIYFIFFKNKVLQERFLYRMLLPDMSHGRNDIFTNINKIIFSDPKTAFLGVGANNYVKVLGLKLSCHNATQEIVVCWGIIGLIIFSLWIYTIIKQGIKNNGFKGIVNVFPFLLLFLCVQASQFIILPMSKFILIILCYSSMCIGVLRSEK
ncbi:MAG: hypothetical protein E6929_14360 [Clostridium sp.]|nr:hypothetical protein [Clostridium sp.]